MAWTTGGLLRQGRNNYHVLFNASATTSGTCSFNIFGSGAKNSLDAYGNALFVDNNTYPAGGDYQSLATMFYDAALGAWMKLGGDGADHSQGLGNGVPPELMVQLCTEAGAHPHFCMPAMALTPMTDYVTSLASYCRDNGSSWMILLTKGTGMRHGTRLRVFTTRIMETRLVSPMGGARAIITNLYGRVMSTIGQAVSTVYSADRSRYQVLCGCRPRRR